MKPITQDRMEQALQYLIDTDELAAAARSEVEREDYRAEAIKDAIFLREDGTGEERKAASKTHVEYMRSTETIVFEAWRSLNSNRRQAS